MGNETSYTTTPSQQQQRKEEQSKPEIKYNPSNYMNDLDVFVSSSNNPRGSDVKIVKDFGFISTESAGIINNASMKLFYQNGEAIGFEKMQSTFNITKGKAMSDLRSKAKTLGANAIFNIKVDLQITQIVGNNCAKIFVVTVCGDAVVTSKNMANKDDYAHCGAPPYMSWPVSLSRLAQQREQHIGNTLQATQTQVMK
jgi:uncharacterized protein YbjQ (UPF0145 family)